MGAITTKTARELFDESLEHDKSRKSFDIGDSTQYSEGATEEDIAIVDNLRKRGQWSVKRDTSNGNDTGECELMRKEAVATLRVVKPGEGGRMLGLRHVALQNYIEADFWDAKRALEKEPKANRAKITYYGYIYLDLYEQHWLHANWHEVPDDLKQYMQKPKKSKFMPIGSSLYVFPEAKKE